MSLGRTRALAFTSLGHFVNDGSVFLVPLVVDILTKLKGITPLETSILLFVFPLSSSPFSVIIGRQADRTGSPGKLTAVGIATLGAGLIGFYFTMQYASGGGAFAPALVCDLLMGFGSSFYHPLGGSILQGTFGERTTGRALGVNGSMGSLGRTLYPSLFYAAAALFTKPGSLAFLGTVGLGSALLIWAGLGRVPFHPHGHVKAATIRESLTKPTTILLGVTFLRSAALFGIVYYMPIFLSTQRGLGIGPILGAVLTLTYAPAMVGQPFFGYLIDRLDHRVVLAISGFGAAASIVGCVSTQGVLSFSLLALFAFFTYTGFPLLMSLASDYSVRKASALGNSIIWGLGDSTGSALGPILVYALTLDEYSRLGFAYEVMAALVAISAAAALLLLPKALRGKSP